MKTLEVVGLLVNVNVVVSVGLLVGAIGGVVVGGGGALLLLLLVFGWLDPSKKPMTVETVAITRMTTMRRIQQQRRLMTNVPFVCFGSMDSTSSGHTMGAAACCNGAAGSAT